MLSYLVCQMAARPVTGGDGAEVSPGRVMGLVRRQPGDAPHPQALAEAAYSLLKERIRTCQLLPGQRLTEKGLVAETGFGKTPVREALGRLVNEALVEVIPRSGYRLCPVTLEDVDELFEVWKIVWPEIVVLASQRITPAELEVLRAISFREEAGIAGVQEMFHLVAAVARNARLAAAMQRSLDEMERLSYLLQRQGVVGVTIPEVDVQILSAFEARDEEPLRQSVRRWLDLYYARTLTALRQLPAVRSATLV